MLYDVDGVCDAYDVYHVHDVCNACGVYGMYDVCGASDAYDVFDADGLYVAELSVADCGYHDLLKDFHFFL